MATTPTTRVTDLARRHRIDIDVATYPASTYSQLLGIFDLKLIEELRAVDDETYEDGGAMRETVTGYNARLEGKIKWSKNAAGTAFDTVQKFLRDKFVVGRGSSMPTAEFGVRWYDRNGLDDAQSQEARAYVKSWAPDGGDSGQPDNISFVIQMQGALSAITNPNGSLLPVVNSVSPTGGAAAGGTSVIISGTHFTGATAVKFGATDATNFSIVNDAIIVATAPAHAAGSVQAKVTTPAGSSADTTADDYLYA